MFLYFIERSYIMSRKGENIYKRKDGRWEGRYIKARTPQGKAVYGSVYASTYNEVRKKRSQAVADLVTDPSMPDIVSLQPQSFAKVSGDWLVSIQPKIKESSYIKYTNLLNSYLLPELSQILISELTSNKIQKCCDHLLTHGGAAREGLSAKTVSDILSLLRNILRFAQVQGMRPAATGREIAIRQISPDTVVLSRSSQDILCRYLYSHMNERNLGILICLFTGLRIGEICALQWEDISLAEGFIYVHQTMQRLQTNGSGNTKTTVKISTPKSKCSIRTIPLPESLGQLIAREFPGRQGFVLACGEEKYVEPRVMQNYFRYVQEQCDLEPVNFHALRHTFATCCVEVGFDVKSLSEILGHANVNITMNRYVHPSMELKHQNMQKLSGLFAVN